MKILLIQENGRHDANRNFRECFCLQRAFINLQNECDVWGLGHQNFTEKIDFQKYDLIINLENYGNGWEPNLSEVRSKKLLWSIDAHCKGEQPFLIEYQRGNYNLLLHSTKDYVNEKFKIWFPNAFDDTLIYPLEIEKKCDLGFCGSLLNRHNYLHILNKNFNFKFDNFVIGNKMVEAINSYKIHWNRNLSTDINYRNFETIGCKIPLVTNYNYQYKLLGFEHGVNFMMYKNEQEMVDIIKLLLQNSELRDSIAENGYQLSKNHTYLKRAEYILELYKDL